MYDHHASEVWPSAPALQYWDFSVFHFQLHNNYKNDSRYLQVELCLKWCFVMISVAMLSPDVVCCVERRGPAGPSHHHVYALLPRIRRGLCWRGVCHGQQRWKRQQLRLFGSSSAGQVRRSICISEADFALHCASIFSFLCIMVVYSVHQVPSLLSLQGYLSSYSCSIKTFEVSQEAGQTWTFIY